MRKPILLLLTIGVVGLGTAPADAGITTSGLFVQHTATRTQEDLFRPFSTKRMCVDRAGTHTFAPDFRVRDANGVDITNTFVGLTFLMEMLRTGTSLIIGKGATFRVTANGVRPVAGHVARINFNMALGDCVDLTFKAGGDLILLRGEVMTASLFLTKEP